MLNVTDGRKVPLPGSSPQGIVDSQGYPLLYGADRPKKLIAARSSGALYPANWSRTLRNRMSTYPDATTIRTWAHMFLLSNEKDAQSILLQHVLGSAAGDNHTALLVKAYLAYFDNIVEALEGAVPADSRQRQLWSTPTSCPAGRRGCYIHRRRLSMRSVAHLTTKGSGRTAPSISPPFLPQKLQTRR